ncbi:MAG: HNH endonuclease domain-containing protein [Phocaeicola sp.]
MILPQNEKLDVRPLSLIYKNTVATYKYYWFIALLDATVKEQKQETTVWELVVGMITEAWYPIHYFCLSFGVGDSFYKQIKEIQASYQIPIDIKKEELKAMLLGKLEEREFKRLIRIFTQNVPYWFLSPWIKSKLQGELMIHSQTFLNDCPYALHGEQVVLNPNWIAYFSNHYSILRDFTFWNLTQFLQKKNPNVPDLSSKLIKPVTRESLTRQRHLWNRYIEVRGSTTCIYTGKVLHKNQFDLDHFIPWSFVSHNLLWNLLPADSSINSAKSNHLPPLEHYLKPYAEQHQALLKTIHQLRPNDKLLEDYLTVHNSIPEMIRMKEEDFYTLFRKTFTPMAQIAENMGYDYWTNTLHV